MMKHSLIIAALLLLAVCPGRAEQQESELTCGNFHAVCLYDDSQGEKLWEVTGIEAGSQGGTVIYITTTVPRILAGKVISGEVSAETSAQGNSNPVTLQFYRRCRCDGGAVIVQDLRDNPNASCLDCCGTDGWNEEVFWFFVPATVGWNGQEIGIGCDPVQLILIEKR